MQRDKLLQLLNTFYKYFPVGVKGLRDSYPGHIEARKIVESKINQIISGQDNAWQRFIQELKSTDKYEVLDMSYLQFPSYVCSLSIEKQDNGTFIFTKSAVVVLSLLTPHYTIYFEDKYRIKTIDSTLTFKVFHLNKLEASAKLDEIFNDLKMRVEARFEDVTYINHYWLFRYEIEGAFPFNDEATIEHQKASLFSLLFNGLESLELTKILE